MQNNQASRKLVKPVDKIIKPEPANTIFERFDESAALNAKLSNPQRRLLLNKLRYIDKNDTQRHLEEFSLGFRDKLI